MTPKIEDLSEKEIRVRIAEICGWKFIRADKHGCNWYESPDGLKTFIHNAPDYLADLNACAEMESNLTASRA